MIPLLGLMFSIYLGFKGVEIFQIGLASNRDERRAPMLVGVLSLMAGIGIGGIFALIWLTSGVPNTPTLSSIP